MATIIDNFFEAVSLNKDKPAVIQGSNALTYSELFVLSQKIAALLQYFKIKKGDRVAIVMENSPEYVAIYYGIIMAKGVVVALNNTAKKDDLEIWMSHAGASFIFADNIDLDADKNKRKVLIEYKNKKYKTIANLDEISEYDHLYQPMSFDENSLATIIYTSGTTGRPKGVMLSHRNLASNMASICKYLPIETNDRVLNVLPFYYSYGNSVLHTNLGRGATIILENRMIFPVKVIENIQNHKATAFYGVASTYAILLSRVKLKEYNLASIRYVTQAGGPMPPAHIEQIMEIMPNAKFFMMYGQTEATARLAYIPAEKIKEKLGSAGKAIPGVELEIRDRHGKKLPAGQEGEVYAKGENIMLGYWQNPEMTKSVLKDGWLRTGDIAKMDADGYLYMTGRRTDMIKSGANRISPKEIEEKLAELDGVEESAAVGIPDEIMGQVIKVFVVKKENSDISKQCILRHCKEKMAQYKIPKEIQFISHLPKTPSGKLQRFKLIDC